MPEVNLSTITFTGGADTVNNTFGPPPGDVAGENKAASIRNTGSVNTLGGADLIRGVLDANTGSSYPDANFTGIDLDYSLSTSSGNDTVTGQSTVYYAAGDSSATGIDLSAVAARTIYLNTGSGNDTINGTGQINGEGTFAYGAFGSSPTASRILTGAGADHLNFAAASVGTGAHNTHAIGAEALQIDTDAHGVACSTDADQLAFSASASGDLAFDQTGTASGLADSKVLTGASGDLVTSSASTALTGEGISATGIGIDNSQLNTGSGSDRIMSGAAAAAGSDGASAGAGANLSGANANATVGGAGGAADHATSFGLSGVQIDAGTGNDTIVGVAAAAAKDIAEAAGIDGSRILTGDGNDLVLGMGAAAAGNASVHAEAVFSLSSNDSHVSAAGGGGGQATASGIARSFIDTGAGDDIVRAEGLADGRGSTSVSIDLLDVDIRLGSGNDLVSAFRADGSNLVGGSGNDRFDLGAGVDTLVNGGSNTGAGDTLSLVGNFDAYAFHQTGYGVHITSANPSVPETDLRVTDVEHFEFADGTHDFGDLFV